ncbi:peptidase S24 [Sphingomonas sp. Leaf17]|uniref:S24 family peptidase n=1 Tax=Sphingomonas sp. Leaf17 TaxID=1735683 RepID=UPI0006FC9358|nr:S24 family peptidase [Sphingomonas sp. Leaf17]KQM64944.1 peptidase S24 [Sphingomonas sp. Leaf17]
MADDDPRTTLAQLAQAGGHSLAALSAMLGRNPAYLQQFVHRGTPRRLSERDRRLLADMLGVDETRLGAVARGPALVAIPRLALAASAGPGAFVDNELTVGSDSITPALARYLGLSADTAASIRVRGDSMEPGLFDGDTIFVDLTSRNPGPRGAVHVVRIDDTLMVKRVARLGNRLVVTSDNPAAGPVPRGAVTVIGRVVWQMRAPR